MKVLFLVPVFLLIILTAQAKRSSTEYTCEISHSYSQTTFDLRPSERKEIEIAGWKVYPMLTQKGSLMEVSLSRIVTVLDASYRKEARRQYPLSTKTLPVELIHSFGGRTDVFNMVCFAKNR